MAAKAPKEGAKKETGLALKFKKVRHQGSLLITLN